ncbi:MAG: tetratricopeptide repeat protein [Proteobacteria bacterium]|jgi:TolA-binding protein|nr:tetratricopeptide repeat protein [Pseudomonadota bacterium]
MRKLFLLLGVLALTGCETLVTRSEVREVESKRQMQEQVSTLQKTTADVNNRFSEIESDLRQVNGRVEVIENKLNFSSRVQADSSIEQNKKILLLQEEMTRVEAQIQSMQADLQGLRQAVEAALSAAPKSEITSSSKKNPFQIGEDEFNQKQWKQAILSYQKYRDTYPRGKSFAEATYKIGVCFQELKMNDEARTFYEEVIAKFPKSNEAKKAQARLKNLKK